jgi:hypothetical protein
MYSGKLFLWLDSLGRPEKIRFREMVHSPYFNKNKDVVRFLDVIEKDKERILSKEQVFSLVFPRKKFNSRRITDQVYYLTRLLEEFLALQKFRNDDVLKRINLLGESLDRNLSKMTVSVSKEIEEDLQNTGYRDYAYYYKEYLFQSERDRYFLGSEQTKRDESLQKKTDSLDLFYISTKLRDCCEMLNRAHIINSTYQVHLLEPIKLYVEAHLSDFTLYPAVGIYYHILLMLQNPGNITHFDKLLELLSSSHKLFPAAELRDMYTYAQNFAIRKVNAGENKFYRSLFEINRTLLDTGLIYIGRFITQRDYKNIVSIALRLGEFEWTLEFISKYKNRLPNDFRQNAYAYNLANYYYESKEYSKAIKLLRDVEFTDVYYNLDAKSMLLKIYFEQAEDEAFFALSNAFKIYLTRNKLINNQNYTAYNNLLKYTKKTFYLKTSLPYQRKKDFPKKINALKGKVETSKNIINSKWLLVQIEALNKD